MFVNDCDGSEVKMFVLTLAGEQRNRKHPVTDQDGSVYTTNGYLKVPYIKGRKNQSRHVIDSLTLTGRSLYCAFGVLGYRLLPLNPPLMMNCERCYLLGGGPVAFVFLRMLGEGVSV